MTTKHFVSTAVLCAAFGHLSAARAEPADVPAAQALFDQGKKLMASGKFADACPKLEESERLDPALGTVLNLADCYEKQGRLASAWSRFVEAQGVAHAGGHADAERVAKDRAAKLAPRLSHLVIDAAAASSIAGLEIKRDGVVVGNAQWGSPIPADAGSHDLMATAPGHMAWTSKVDLAANAATATVHVPALETEPVAASPVAPAPVTIAPASESPAPPPFTPDSSNGTGLGSQRTWALVAGGAGVAGVVVGTIFGLTSKSKHDDAANLCPDPQGAGCSTQAGADAWDSARSAGNVSTIAFIVGGAGLAAGAVLWLTAKPANPASTSAGITAGFGSVNIAGRW